MTTSIQIPFPNKKYQIIYADPPWDYDNWSPLRTDKLSKKCGRMLYPTMELEDICSLPIDRIADKNCILFLWATMPNLEKAFRVINSWGFIYKTVAFTWVKSNPTGWGYYSGMGNWTLANPELCLLATHRTFPKRQEPVKQLIIAPRERHSQKPAEIRDRIVVLLGDLPRIELFARQKTEGWDIWGDEVVESNGMEKELD